MNTIGDKRFDSRPKDKHEVREHDRRTKSGTTRVKKHFRSKKQGERFTFEESKAIQKEVDAEKYDEEEFHAGMNEELEHWDITQGDPFETADIVIAHLKEDGEYYEKLEYAMDMDMDDRDEDDD